MNRNGIVVERLYRGDHLLMDLPGDKHKEREALLLVVVLNHKVIEICPILQVLVKRFNVGRRIESGGSGELFTA